MSNLLGNEFTIYFHFPQDSDWTINSYVKLFTFETVEEMLEIFKKLPAQLIEKGMIFIMKGNIKPMWEDDANKNGGSFSYKISRPSVCETFRLVTYAFCGRSLSTNLAFLNTVNGISISPKQGDFCIIKIWTQTLKFQDPTVISRITKTLTPVGCLFSPFKTK